MTLESHLYGLDSFNHYVRKITLRHTQQEQVGGDKGSIGSLQLLQVESWYGQENHRDYTTWDDLSSLPFLIPFSLGAFYKSERNQ